MNLFKADHIQQDLTLDGDHIRTGKAFHFADDEPDIKRRVPEVNLLLTRIRWRTVIQAAPEYFRLEYRIDRRLGVV